MTYTMKCHFFLCLFILFAFDFATFTQENVTNLYLSNADFESMPISFIDNSGTTTANLISNDGDGSPAVYDIPIWEEQYSSWARIGSVNFGITQPSTNRVVNGLWNPSLSIPATDKYGVRSGAGVVFSGAWTGKSVLSQKTKVALKGGRYALVYTAQNVTDKAIGQNRFGFVSNSGVETYGSKTVFPKGVWVNDTIRFHVLGSTEGSISVGFIGLGTGSGSSAFVYVDDVQLLYEGVDLRLYNLDLNQKMAVAISDTAYIHNPGYININLFRNAIQLAKTVEQTEESLLSAITALNAAIDSYKALVAEYQPLRLSLMDATDLLKNTDYSGKPALVNAFMAANSIYESSTDQRNVLTATILTLQQAIQAYRHTRASEWITIKNGALWNDQNGNPVQAHGAGFLQMGDRWYMVGEDRSYSNAGVNLYSSSDLTNWKFEKKIIPPSAYSSSRFIERPKLLRCPKTGKFVVWCHYEGENYAPSEAASFECDSVNGLYKLHFGARPLNIKSRDCNVFVDNDGTAYFISTTNDNSDLGLFRLSDDYLEVASHTAIFTGQGREAPALVRIGNTYFMISSACSGWAPNRAKISYSTSLQGGWSSLSNLRDEISYDTQAASILTVQGSKGTTYLYVGDRWQDPGLAESKTIIFPIQFNGTTCTFNYKQQFDLNFLTGEVRETEVNNRVPKAAWKIRSFSSEETSSENGAAANAIDGNATTKWHSKYSSPAAVAPHFIEVDMGAEYLVSGFLATPRTDGKSNGLIRDFILQVSTDGINWSAVAGGGWLPYWSDVNFKPVSARYFRLTSISGALASLSEIDMLTNTPAYTLQAITPWYKIGTGSWQSADHASVVQASTMVWGPNTSGYGSWATYGPNFQLFGTRECTINNVMPADAGKYMSFYLNPYNQVSTKEFNLSVQADVSVKRRMLQLAVNKAKAVFMVGFRGSEELQKAIALSELYSWPTSGATAEQLTNQHMAMLAATDDYIKDNLANSIDRTSLLSTPKTYTSLTPIGWQDKLTGFGSGCGEFLNDSTFSFQQTVNNLENGFYLVTVQSFYRNGPNDKGAGYENANEVLNVSLFANSKSIAVNSLYRTPTSGAGSLNGYCNTLLAASKLFDENPKNYNNFIVVEVTNGQLTFGLKKTTIKPDDWCVFNNFSLNYLGLPTGLRSPKRDEMKGVTYFDLHGRKISNPVKDEPYIQQQIDQDNHPISKKIIFK